ncbi:hypothetical protein IGK44_000880 [Enterococcus sp. DIV1248a]|uniref:polysaccharide deacetylase family protein n=1 Tax=Enterococcus sp. DIV1248a TaxID=2774836 RepID=UPI003F28B64D
MNEDNKIFKTNEFSIEVSPVENTKQVKNVQYFSYDENSGLQLIHILMDGKPLDLPNGTEIRLSAVKLNNQNQKLIYTPEIVDPLNGIVSFVIPREFLGYQGRIRCGLYINFSNNQTMHVGYFYINMGVSDIDTNLTEFTEDFWQGWSEFEASSTAKMQELEAVLDAEAKRLTEHANQKITEYDQYIASGKSDWEDFVDSNKKVLESIDPGGVLTSEMIESRGNYPKLPERLENTDLAVEKVQNSNEDNLSAAFCFVDDDSKTEVYTVLKPIFDARNAKFSTAVITENIGTDRFMNSTQLKELAADGYEIMSHTANHLHLTQLTDEELTHELTRSKQMLIDWGFNPEYIMYPFGDFNDRVIKETRKYYKAAASTNHHNLNLRPVNTYSIGRVGVGIYGPIPLTFETVKEYVDQAIENKTLCCFMTHIAETPEENVPIIGQLIDYIQSLGYDVTTFGEAYKKHQNVLEYGDYPLTEKSQYLAVGAGGEIDPYFGRYLVNRPKESVLTKPITDYHQNFVTEEFIQTINAEGYPNDEPGILRTHRLTDDTEGDFREYVTLKSKKMYLSFWNKNTAAWGVFSEIGPDTSVDIVDKLNYGTAFTDPWTYYQKGKRHILKIPTRYSTSFPVPGNGGTLITENLIGEREFCWQLYHPVNSRDIFKRIPTSDSAWGAFKRVGDA